MNPIFVRLPLPPKRLHPNEKPKWQEHQRWTKKARGDAKIQAIIALNGGPKPYWRYAGVMASWSFRQRRKRDEANLQGWLKAYIDGCVDAGILVDDNADNLVWSTPEITIAHRTTPFVILKFTQGIALTTTPDPCPKNPPNTSFATPCTMP